MQDDWWSDRAPRLLLRSLYVRKNLKHAVFEVHLEIEGGWAWEQIKRSEWRERTLWYYPHTSPQSSRQLCLDERLLTAAGKHVLSRPEMLSVFVVIWLLTCEAETKQMPKASFLQLPPKIFKPADKPNTRAGRFCYCFTKMKTLRIWFKLKLFCCSIM